MTPLGTKLRRLAVDYPSRRDELIRLADELDEKAKDLSNVRGILGAWARARRLYCDITGEPLV